MPIQTASQALGNESSGSPFGFKNRIINGAMVIDQRNGGASATSITGYKFFTDRWQSYGSAGGTFTGQQLTTSSAPGFSHYLRLTVTSADASLASDDFYSLQQRIEGYNVSDFGWGTSNAKPITLSFWVRSSLTGQFGGSLMSGYGLPFTYTINQANTWEYKTLTFSPLTSSNWISSRFTNDEGAILWFDLGFGSGYRGTSGVLGAGAYGATGDTNWISTNGATFDITGVQLEKNIQATNFDWRPYGTELSLCQRYYFQNEYTVTYDVVLTSCFIGGTAEMRGTFQFPTTMRVNPTMSNNGVGNFRLNDSRGNDQVCNGIFLDGISKNFAHMRFTKATGNLTIGNCGYINTEVANDAYVYFNAEL